MYSVCILNYNDCKTTIELIKLVSQYASVNNIVVVDNASTDNSYNELIKFASTKIRVLKSDKNGGYGYGNNIGVMYCYNILHEKYVAICNPDVIVKEESLKVCCAYLERHQDTTIAVPQMLDRSGDVVEECVWPIQTGLQYLCFSLKIVGFLFNKKYSFNTNNVVEVDCVAGSLLVIDTESFIKYGLYDENIFLFCEETVLGIKLKNRKRKSVLIKDNTFIHYHSVSINKNIRSQLVQKKIMWESRLYVLKEYYKWNRFQMVFAKIISKICLFEEYLVLNKDRIKGESI